MLYTLSLYHFSVRYAGHVLQSVLMCFETKSQLPYVLWIVKNIDEKLLNTLLGSFPLKPSNHFILNLISVKYC